MSKIRLGRTSSSRDIEFDSFAGQDADALRILHESITPEQIEQAANSLPGQGYAELSDSEHLTMFRAYLMTYEQLAAHFQR